MYTVLCRLASTVRLQGKGNGLPLSSRGCIHLDDIIICFDTFPNNLSRLEDVLERLHQYILGRVVSVDRVKNEPEKIL